MKLISIKVTDINGNVEYYKPSRNIKKCVVCNTRIYSRDIDNMETYNKTQECLNCFNDMKDIEDDLKVNGA